jgi:hypothetical protein
MSRRTTNPHLLLPLATTNSIPPTPFTPFTSSPLSSHTSSRSSASVVPAATSSPSGGGGTSASRAEALWSQMQSALLEVESSHSALFFVPAHARALEELRAAQMALAQAWMISDSAEGPEGGGGGADKKAAAADAHFQRVADGVRDVSEKLERVAEATRQVEVESRGIWEESTDGSVLS